MLVTGNISRISPGPHARDRKGEIRVTKVLIVEDDLMIADSAEEVLVEYGYRVCGIARTIAEAVDLGFRHRPDIAVIDLRLADGGFMPPAMSGKSL